MIVEGKNKGNIMERSINNQTYQTTGTFKDQVRSHPRRIGPASFWMGLAALLVILPVILSSAVIIYFQVQQLNLPGVAVFDAPVGLLSYEETSERIDSSWNKNRRINLIAGAGTEISYWFSPEELGLWVDPQATANAAYNIGRDKDPFADILKSIRGEPQVVYPVLYFDVSIARATLSKIAETHNIQAQEAQVIFKDGKWAALPGSDGQVVNSESTIQDLQENAFSILLSGTASLDIQPQSPTTRDLTHVLDDIEGILSQAFELTAYDPIDDESFQWSVPIETRHSWVKYNPNNHSVQMNYDEKDVSELLLKWEEDLGEGRTFDEAQAESIVEHWQKNQVPKLSIKHNPTTYQVSAGESLWSISLKLGMPMYHIMEANPGLTANNLSTGMVLTIPSKNILLPLPVVENKRIIVDISEQRMTVYENGQIRNTHIVSTGVSDSPTMAGIFQVQTHELNAYASNWDLYMPHFMGIYEAWPGFMNGIHGLPLLSGGGRLWASALGSPASYGCIILDLAAAEDLYNWADPGVVVEITD
jgi:LysM repeat protein